MIIILILLIRKILEVLKSHGHNYKSIVYVDEEQTRGSEIITTEDAKSTLYTKYNDKPNEVFKGSDILKYDTKKLNTFAMIRHDHIELPYKLDFKLTLKDKGNKITIIEIANIKKRIDDKIIEKVNEKVKR